jgi:antitoxin MazE
METVIKEWGNSLAIRLPKSLLKELGVGKDTKVELKIENNKLLIEPKREKRLDDLLAKIEEKNIHQEIDFGKPEGKEVW